MKKSVAVLLAICLCLSGCGPAAPLPQGDKGTQEPELRITGLAAEGDKEERKLSLVDMIEEIPPYSGSLVVEIPPYGFEETSGPFHRYSEHDILGRCGQAEALLGRELMPEEERGEIGSVKPTGWHTVRYDDIIEDRYLYNRCHLIGYQLAGENANDKNLITGTRYFNVEGMEPYENMVAGYIRLTGNHVHYRVIPVFEGDDLLAKGVWMEAESAEDGGEGVSFSIFVYNVQPGIWLDYGTGDSSAEADTAGNRDFVLNTRTKKFHTPDCKNVADIQEGNRKGYKGSREELVEDGYVPCGWCKP